LHLQRDLLKHTLTRKHYVICNAMSQILEPFKDRLIMEGDPSAVLEGMTIAALATARARLYLLRGESPSGCGALVTPLTRRERDGFFLGQNISTAGLRFDIEVRRGAAAYLCGERDGARQFH